MQNIATVAIKTGDNTITETFEGQRKHSACLLDCIQALLEKSKVTIQDCDAIVIGNGPGSFMGVRLAHAVGQALCLPNNTPLITLSSLQLLAHAAYLEQGIDSVVVAQDARKQEIYLGEYALRDGVMQAVNEDRLCTPEALSLTQQYSACVGNGWSAYQNLIPSEIVSKLNFIDAVKVSLAEAAIDIVMKDKSINHQASSQPNYVRNHVADLPKP
jgi:tRNA threonylcarbamoyladenosine biosynthesis protein TsaB